MEEPIGRPWEQGLYQVRRATKGRKERSRGPERIPAVVPAARRRWRNLQLYQTKLIAASGSREGTRPIRSGRLRH
ncbi:hypothetical protein J6590_051992 [Homalodisca vitripennis]|nr:hypothetical protein J6590_051992 [Homalodisca vitripennis]